MLHLPVANSTIRDLVDVETIATMRRQDVPFVSNASAAHRETMKSDKSIKSINFVAASADGNVYLYSVGNRGGNVRKLWNFGAITGFAA